MWGTLFTVVGKRPGRRSKKLISTVGNSPLLFVSDSCSGQRFLIDSGAEVSVAPFTSCRPPTSTLKTADGRPVSCWGHTSVPVVIDGVNYGNQRFLKAAVQHYILGADFFFRTGVCIDVKQRRLCPPTSVTVAAVESSGVDDEHVGIASVTVEDLLVNRACLKTLCHPQCRHCHCCRLK